VFFLPLKTAGHPLSLPASFDEGEVPAQPSKSTCQGPASDQPNARQAERNTKQVSDTQVNNRGAQTLFIKWQAQER
jgi:hypothetical protein